MNMHAKITPTTILLEKLRHGHEYPGASVNARITGREQDLDALVASIKSEGILQSLLVCPGPKGDLYFYVIAGNRRLAALRKLKWTGDIPVIVRDDVTPGSALAMSLAENVTQCPLHPVDRFETFAALIDSGKTEADIAANFCIKERVVKQSLALGRLAPKIRNAWREGKIDASDAKAFTLTDDQKAQEEVFDKLTKGHRISSWQIRAELVGDQSDAKKFLKFVGKKAYETAGGKLQEDLFAHRPGDPKRDEDEDYEPDDGPMLVGDFPLLVRLTGEKIKAKCDSLVAEGWAWAADDDDLPDGARWNWPKIKNDNAKAPKDQKARSGCVLRVDYNGELDITYGVIKPGSKALPTSAAAKDTKATKKAPTALSNALKDRLEEQLTHATQDALKAQSEGKTLAHLLAGIVASQIRPGLPMRSPSEINKAFNTIRERLPANDLNAAIAKRFDAKAYFMGAPKALVIKAIAEMGFDQDAKKLAAGTKAAAWKWAIPHHKGTGWLPQQLRTIHYTGPGATKKKGK